MREFEIIERMNPWWRDPRHRALPSPLPLREAFADLWGAARGDPARERATVLLGARQIGKSTLLRQVLDEALDSGRFPPSSVLFVDFSSDLFAGVPSLREVLEGWEIESGPHRPRLLLLDEISQAPNWAKSLKALVDANRSGASADTLIATDSSASILRGGAKDFLQGRLDEIVLTGLVYSEFVELSRRPEEDAEAFRSRVPALERYLSLGGFPEHRFEDDPARSRARIRSDIIERAILRDLGREKIDVSRARRLFIYLVRDSGAVFTAAKRARDLTEEGEKATDARSTQEWARLLEQASLIASLQPWFPANQRVPAGVQLRGRPKIYAADHGLISAFDPAADPRQRPEVEAKILETAVFTHLRAIANRTPGVRLGFFNESVEGRAGELDFIVDTGSGCFAVEVTSSRRTGRKIPKAAPILREAQIDRLLIVHRGPTSERADGVRLVNAEEFLLNPLAHMEL